MPKVPSHHTDAAQAKTGLAERPARGLGRPGPGALMLLICALATASQASAGPPPPTNSPLAANPGVETMPGLGTRGGSIWAEPAIVDAAAGHHVPSSQSPAPQRPTLEEVLQAAWRGILRWAINLGSSQSAASSTTLPRPRAAASGLVIESVNAKPIVQDGHAALSISGLMRNLEPSPQPTLPLRVSLFNTQGRRVWSKRVSPAQLLVPAGETRQFNFVILDPPASADQLEVVFDPARRSNLEARPRPMPSSP